MSATTSFLNKVPRNTLSAIDDDLDTLEESLEHLLARPLDETLEKLSVIQRAKLHTLVPYVVNDLIIMYLKMKGVDPKGHPVMDEMKRVKAYFEKIHEAEHPDTNPNKVDKAVANRFIKHAIGSLGLATANGPPKLAADQIIGSHLRFDVQGLPITDAAAEKIAARNVESSSDSDSDESELKVDEGDLAGPSQVVQGQAEEAVMEDVVPEPEPPAVPSLSSSKRKRLVMDPFAGYDIGTPTASSQQDESESSPKKKKARKKKKKKVTEKAKQTQMDVPEDGDGGDASE